MGKYVTRVGKYHAVMGDYEWDYLKDGESLEYYKDFKFNVRVSDLMTNKEYEYEVPVLDNFITIDIAEDGYEYTVIEKNHLYVWLFNSVVVKEDLYLKVHIDCRYGEYPTKWATYYLDSELFESVVLVENDNNKIFKIDSLEQTDWIYNKGLNSEWVDKNGNKFI